MATKSMLIGSALAVALLAGCSSSTSGTPTATSTTSSSTTTSSTTSSSSVPSTTSEDTSSSEASSSATPAQLDAASTAWFTNMCTSAGTFVQKVQAVSSEAQASAGDQTSIEGQQATFAATLSGIAEGFAELSSSIGSVPPPTIPGGEAAAAALVSGINTAAASIGDEATKFAGATFTDPAALQAAVQAASAQIGSTVGAAQTHLTDLQKGLSPEVQAAVDKIPQCAALGS
jgi:hypothetical protein